MAHSFHVTIATIASIPFLKRQFDTQEFGFGKSHLPSVVGAGDTEVCRGLHVRRKNEKENGDHTHTHTPSHTGKQAGIGLGMLLGWGNLGDTF